MGPLVRPFVITALGLGNSLSRPLVLAACAQWFISALAELLALPFGERTAVLPVSPSLHKLRGCGQVSTGDQQPCRALWGLRSTHSHQSPMYLSVLRPHTDTACSQPLLGATVTEVRAGLSGRALSL